MFAFVLSRLKFLSTPSARRATRCIATTTPKRIDISIHALREEGDGIQRNNIPKTVEISIHALREEGDLCGQTC